MVRDLSMENVRVGFKNFEGREVLTTEKVTETL